MAKTKVKFIARPLVKSLLKELCAEQTERLIEYAKNEVIRIGDAIQTYNSKNHMDRTGNLLNSLCWGVTLNGEMKGSGFYREEVLHSRGQEGGTESWLHEFFPNDAIEVKGRNLAQSFITSYKGRKKGWDVFFAILAPYWGYWESGFKMKSGGSTVYSGTDDERTIPFSVTFKQFQVMSHAFDDVRRDLTPSETHLTVYVPKYAYKNPKWRKQKGVYQIGKQR